VVEVVEVSNAVLSNKVCSSAAMQTVRTVHEQQEKDPRHILFAGQRDLSFIEERGASCGVER
jgi:hypothetical protein